MQAPPHDWKPGDPIGYIQPDFPEFDLPSHKGERYEALVPDTLDLQHRARMALHCMTEATNPEADYEIYGIVQFLCRPPQMQMDWGGPTVQVKFQEAVPLVRMICGSDQNLHVERRWMETTLQSIGDDGLIYTPIGGRPWTRRRYAGLNPPANGQERALSWAGRYAVVRGVAPGDVTTLRFPIFERTDTVYIEKERFTLVRKGNDVVSISPPGRFCPLYQRRHYRQDTPRWRKVVRFISDEVIDW